MSVEQHKPGWHNMSQEEGVWRAAAETEADRLQEGDAAHKRAFDLEERTARFGEAIIRFAKRIPFNPVNNINYKHKK